MSAARLPRAVLCRVTSDMQHMLDAAPLTLLQHSDAVGNMCLKRHAREVRLCAAAVPVQHADVPAHSWSTVSTDTIRIGRKHTATTCICSYHINSQWAVRTQIQLQPGHAAYLIVLPALATVPLALPHCYAGGNLFHPLCNFIFRQMV